MDDKEKLIAAVKAARALLEDVGFEYTWVVAVKSVDEDLDNRSFTLNGHTWDEHMPGIALLAIAAGMLKRLHKNSGMSLEDMLEIILNNIANVDDDDEDDKEE